jgi:uncharacterized coiled-coil protein SlyX
MRVKLFAVALLLLFLFIPVYILAQNPPGKYTVDEVIAEFKKMQAEKQRELEKQKEALRKSAERVQEKYIKTANAQEKEEGEEDGKSNEDKKEERE